MNKTCWMKIKKSKAEGTLFEGNKNLKLVVPCLLQKEKNDNSSIRLAIVGRPNSGKSTLTNTLLGSNSVLTGDKPGVTRDSIMLDLKWKGQDIQLIDTAGMRKKSKVIDKIEKLSVKSAIDSVKYAQIVILVLDCNEALSRQDLAIASHIIEEGRVLVIAANKWDVVIDKNEVRVALRNKLNQALSQFCLLYTSPSPRD